MTYTHTYILALSSLQLQAETRNKVFAEKLETLLHRAYHLQEDFGSSIPTDSVLADFGKSHFVGFIGRVDAPAPMKAPSMTLMLVIVYHINLPKYVCAHTCIDLVIQPVSFLLWQRVKEHLSCLKLRVSTDYEMMMPLLFLLTIPFSQLQRSVQFSYKYLQFIEQ